MRTGSANVAPSVAGDVHQPRDSIDFELTDFDQARAALEQLPAGVKTTKRHEQKDWSKRRRPLEESDVRLTPLAMSWLERLPHGVRPLNLPHSYPRILNQLAAAWNDVDACLAMLDDLVVDQRGDRHGFPSNIALELVALRDHRGAIERLRR